MGWGLLISLSPIRACRILSYLESPLHWTREDIILWCVWSSRGSWVWTSMTILWWTGCDLCASILPRSFECSFCLLILCFSGINSICPHDLTQHLLPYLDPLTGGWTWDLFPCKACHSPLHCDPFLHHMKCNGADAGACGVTALGLRKARRC